MDLRWLDDLVALAEARTLSEAAALRNVTQPAFSRRIQQIERWFGAPVLDRSSRPARVTPGILSKIETIRALTLDLRQLRRDVTDWEAAERRVSIAAQHSISAGILPRFVARMQDSRPGLSIRLRSANRDGCYTLMMTRQASMMIAYETGWLPVTPDETLVERAVLDQDELAPVATPDRARAAAALAPGSGTLPIIGFPPHVFFGVLFSRNILPELRRQHALAIACETALVPAVLALALEGVGVAWLPRALCASHLRAGRLVELDRRFGTVPMEIVAARMTTPRSRHAEAAWAGLQQTVAEGFAAP